MSVKFPFKKKHEHYLGGKSLMLMNEKIILVGGTSIQKEKDMGNKNIFCREDYFL